MLLASIPSHAGPRLDRLPIGPFHWRMLRLIGAGMFLDGFEIYLAGGVLGALLKEGWSNLDLNAHFISATFAGMVIGTWLAGVLGDRYGRRFSYQINLLLFGFASLAAAAAPSMAWLIVARFFMGIGLAAEIVAGYAALAEFVPPASRGRWLSGLAICTNSALFVSSLIGYVVIPNLGWRAMFIIAGAGALIIWAARKGMPESPRWLETKGRFDEADLVLRAIEGEAAKTQPLPPVVSETNISQPAKARSIAALFSRQFLGRTLLGSLICIAVSVSVYGLIVWLPSFFVKQNYSMSASLGFSALMTLGAPAGAIIGAVFADRMGRRRGVIGSALATVVLSSIYPFAHNEALFVAVGFALISAIYVFVTVGWCLYVPEMFPTDIRMRGVGICNMAGRMTTIVIPYAIVWIFDAFRIAGVIGLVTAIMLLSAIATYALGTETAKSTM